MESTTFVILIIFIAIVTGEPEEGPIQDIIRAFELTSPTLILDDELLDMCYDFEWMLCLTTSQHSEHDIANHLNSLHLDRKQDGVIFLEGGRIGRVLDELAQLSPSLFRDAIQYCLKS